MPNQTLEFLSVDNTRITNAALRHVKRLPRLDHLSLSDTDIDDGALEDLAKLKRLRMLVLMRTKISNDGELWLEARLPDCEIVTDQLMRRRYADFL